MKTNALCVESNKVEFHRAAVNVAPVFDLALHTAEPESDDQGSNEVILSGYERVSVMRDEASWVVVGRKVLNAVKITFPTIKSGSATASHLTFGIGGKVRRTLKLDNTVELKANRRVEFDVGEIEIEEKE